jgi:hypothetical protein
MEGLNIARMTDIESAEISEVRFETDADGGLNPGSGKISSNPTVVSFPR